MVTFKIKYIDVVQYFSEKTGSVSDRIVITMVGEKDDLEYKLIISAPSVKDFEKANIPLVPMAERTMELTEVNRELSEFVPGESTGKKL